MKWILYVIALQIAWKNRIIKIYREIFLNTFVNFFPNMIFLLWCLEIFPLSIQFNPNVTNFYRNSKSKFCIDSINFVITKFWFFFHEFVFFRIQRRVSKKFHNKLFKDKTRSNLILIFNFFCYDYCYKNYIIIPCYRKN